MKEFMLLFRHAPDSTYQPSQEAIEAEIKKWQDWIGNIAAQGKFKSTNQLDFEGKVLKPGNILTDGPYAEVKEIIGGYLILEAASMEEAVTLAQDCPILEIPSATVEIRAIINIQ